MADKISDNEPVLKKNETILDNVVKRKGKRVCLAPGCGCILSIYNKEKYCSLCLGKSPTRSSSLTSSILESHSDTLDNIP